MLLDYNEKEKLLLDELQQKFKPSLDKLFTAYCEAETAFEKLDEKAQQGKRKLTDEEAKIVAAFERTHAEYINMMTEYEKSRSVITQKAETRETKYFEQHTEKLTKLLERNIEAQVASFGILKNQAEIQNIYQDNEEMKKRILITCHKYLEILEKNDIEKYQRIISFIDNSIADKEAITQTYRIKLEGNQTKSSRWDTSYLYLRQNNATNNFNKTARLNSTRGSFSLWNEQATYQQGNLTIFIPHYETLLQNTSISKNGEISTPTKKVLDIASIIFDSNGHNPSIRFSLEDYMKLCGLTDKKRAREQVNSALEVLFDISISYDDSKNKNKSKNYRDMRIVDDKGIKNGMVYLHFAHTYSEMLAECSSMPYPLAMLQASKGRENRNSFYIARRISEHRFMNAGKENEHIISVRTLLEAAPFLATEEEVRNSDRRLYDRIIKPFISDLDEACNSLGIGSEGYELHYAGGEKIPSNKLEELDYETFTNAYVWFDELPEYPNQEKRLETKAKIAEAALTATKKKHRTKKKNKGA